MLSIVQNKKLIQFALLVVVFMVLCVVIKPSEANFLWRFPPLIAGLPYLINNCVSYLMYDFLPIEMYDPEIEELSKDH